MLVAAAVLATLLVAAGFVALEAMRGLTRLEDHIVASASRNPRRRRRMVPQAVAVGARARRRT